MAINIKINTVDADGSGKLLPDIRIPATGLTVEQASKNLRENMKALLIENGPIDHLTNPDPIPKDIINVIKAAMAIKERYEEFYIDDDFLADILSDLCAELDDLTHESRNAAGID